jgi:hypothetical protein
MRDVYTYTSIQESGKAITRVVAILVQNLLKMSRSGKGRQNALITVLKNNHKGYMSSFTNTVSYSV